MCFRKAGYFSFRKILSRLGLWGRFRKHYPLFAPSFTPDYLRMCLIRNGILVNGQVQARVTKKPRDYEIGVANPNVYEVELRLPIDSEILSIEAIFKEIEYSMKEIDAYQWLKRHVPIALAHFYAVYKNEQRKYSWMLIEKLSPLTSIFGNSRPDKLSIERFLKQIAMLHAFGFNNRTFREQVRDKFGEKKLSSIEKYCQFFQRRRNQIERIDTSLSKDLFYGLNALSKVNLATGFALLNTQSSIIHGDHPLTECLERKTTGEIVLIDWGNFCIGPIAVDVMAVDPDVQHMLLVREPWKICESEVWDLHNYYRKSLYDHGGQRIPSKEFRAGIELCKLLYSLHTLKWIVADYPDKRPVLMNNVKVFSSIAKKVVTTFS